MPSKDQPQKQDILEKVVKAATEAAIRAALDHFAPNSSSSSQSMGQSQSGGPSKKAAGSSLPIQNVTKKAVAKSNSVPAPRPPPVQKTQSLPVPKATSSKSSSVAPSSSDVNDIVITVDAKKNRGSGFVRLPESKEIHFYSIDWSKFLTLPDNPDKWYLVSALIAFKLFKDIIEKYRKKYKCPNVKLECKGSHSILSGSPKTYAGEGNTEYKEWYLRITDELKAEPLKGEWKEVIDDDTKLAGKLSKHDFSSERELPDGAYGDYRISNSSKDNPENFVRTLTLPRHFLGKNGTGIASTSNPLTNSMANLKVSAPASKQQNGNGNAQPKPKSSSPAREKSPSAQPSGPTPTISSPPRSSPTPSPPIPKEITATKNPEDPNSIVIALEATSKIAAGMMRIPQSGTVYFYSIKWSEVFKLPDKPDIFHLLNAMLAVELFKTYYRAAIKTISKKKPTVVVFKGIEGTNNVFVTPKETLFSREKDSQFKALLDKISLQMRSKPFFSSVWHTRPKSDNDLQFVSILSRTDHSKNDFADIPNTPDYNRHSHHNKSMTDFSALHTLALEIPIKDLLKK